MFRPYLGVLMSPSEQIRRLGWRVLHRSMQERGRLSLERDNNRTRALLAGYYRTEDSDPSAYANSLPVTARVHSGPAPSHASDSQSGSHQTLPVLRRRHSVPMPPLRKPSVLPGTESWLPPISLQHIFEVVLLVAFFVSGLTSIFALRKRGRMTSSGMGQDDKAMNQEKKPGIHQRKDSYQEEDLHPSSGKMEGLGATLEEKSSTERQNDVVVHRPSLDQEPNQYLQSLRQETLQPILSPIYPWIAPPQDLPGPYDAPYYPPPLPTIKTEESLQNDNQPGTTKTEPPSDDVPEELETITYTRRISTTSTSDQESLVEGTVTVSTKGWRRTQWSVTAG